MRSFIFGLLASFAALPCFAAETIEVRGLGTLPYQQLLEAVSNDGESLDAFIQRIAPELDAYSRKTGFEACAVIAQEEGRFGLVIGTNHSHIFCANQASRVPDGMTTTGMTMHSHPIGNYYRVNAQDRLMLGPLTRVGEQIKRGSSGFSKEDYESGPGYLVESGRVLFQEGPKKNRIL